MSNNCLAIDLGTGQHKTIPLTAEEEAARDVEEAQHLANLPMVTLSQKMQTNSAGLTEDLATFIERFYDKFPDELAARSDDFRDLYAERKDLQPGETETPTPPQDETGWKSLIGTAVASGGPALTVPGLTGDYVQYLIIISDLVLEYDGTHLSLRIGDADGIDMTSGDYNYHMAQLDSDSKEYSGSISDGFNRICLAFGVGNDTGEGFGAVLYLTRSKNGVTRPMITGTTVYTDSSGAIKGGPIVASRTAVIYLDRVQIYPLSGGITSGSMTVYGIA